MKTVIEMAREVGAGEPESLYGRTDYVVMTKFELERLVELARADERNSWPAQQEPVAWMHPDGRIWTFGRGLDKSTFTVPLYTSPPAQRTWVGLTDGEITDIWAESSPYYHEDDFARAIEAKLKEKNNGN